MKLSERQIKQRQIRIRLSLAALGYEVYNESLFMTDEEYDKLSLEVKPKLPTGHKIMDKFFRTEFDPSTGSWIHKHPEIEKLKTLYHNLKEYRNEQNNRRNTELQRQRSTGKNCRKTR